MTDALTPRSAGTTLRVDHAGTHAGYEHYRVGECNVLQNDAHHFSISHPRRYPTWDEIAAARYALLPRLRDCVMVLPPEDEYVNLHPNCFHVHLLRGLGPGGRFHNPEAW